MRSIREILRLRQCGLSHRQIGEAVHKSSATVSGYLARAAAAKLTWPLPEELDDFALEALLFPPQKELQNARPEPNFVHMHKELKRKGVTKTLLWQEYKEQNPDGLQFSQFCEKYKKWLGAINVTMRIQHVAGEKVFSDFAGNKLKLTNRETGEAKDVHVFVCALGASGYFFADAFLDETSQSWCAGHVNAFNYFQGAPAIISLSGIRIQRRGRSIPFCQKAHRDHARSNWPSILLIRPAIFMNSFDCWRRRPLMAYRPVGVKKQPPYSHSPSIPRHQSPKCWHRVMALARRL